MHRTRLADVLPSGDARLAAHDGTLGSVDPRRVPDLKRNTLRQYERWLRAYKAWCAERRYQPELRFLTDDKAQEWVESLVVDTEHRPRYAPSSVAQALTALGHWAEKAAVDPMPSFRPASRVLHRYTDELAAVGVVASRRDRRIRPPARQD